MTEKCERAFILFMSVFEGIVGHEIIIRVLEHALQEPAHGYLFCGPRGVGKTTVGERFATGLLEVGDGVLSSHPDFIRLTREEGAREIVVKQVRELLNRMQLTSARGGYKVALIEQAERLNEEAANALLKAVEEPSPKTVYLFITEQPDRLPATLRSRLTKIEFGSIRRAVRQPAEGSGEAGMVWDETLNTLLGGPLGKRLAAIERLAQSVEGQEDPETAWREALEGLMRALDQAFEGQPAMAMRLAKGLTKAWALVGSVISPRLALEWALIPDEAKQGRAIPRIMQGG